MNIDQLKLFCSIDDTRHHLQAPFSREQWTFATNGHICVRVPRLAEVGEVEGAPDCVKLFNLENFEDPARQWVDPPEPVIEITQCVWCKGTGYIRFDKHAEEVSCHRYAKDAQPCESCDGGTIRSGYNLIAGPKGETKLAAIYIELIRALPNSKIGLLGNESDWVGTHTRKDKRKDNQPVCFRFDGGDGLLMPVRNDNWTGSKG